MKSQEIDIAHMLSAYEPEMVKKGIKIYLEGKLFEEMYFRKWRPYKDKPSDVEYYEIDGEYWVQDKEYRPPITHGMPTNKICSECGEKLRLYRVPSCPKMNPKQWKSRYECSGDWCTYEEYSLQEITEELKTCGNL